MTGKLDDLVEDYLNDVNSQLRGVNKSQREELLLDLREHIAALRADEQANSEADIRNILDRLGSPETVAAAARSEAGVATEAAASRPVRRKQIIIWSVIAVVVVLVLVYLLFFSFSSENVTASWRS